jgi:hypothetical protein
MENIKNEILMNLLYMRTNLNLGKPARLTIQEERAGRAIFLTHRSPAWAIAAGQSDS